MPTTEPKKPFIDRIRDHNCVTLEAEDLYGYPDMAQHPLNKLQQMQAASEPQRSPGPTKGGGNTITPGTAKANKQCA